MKNKFKTLSILACSGLAFGLFAPKSQAITINFSNLGGAVVRFTGTGDTFTFLPGGNADQFSITTVNGGVGDSVGDKGYSSGTWTIGAITTSGLTQMASVTGNGQIVIHDGTLDLIGTLTWDTIFSSGTIGGININGVLNVTSIHYTGTQNDLVALAAAGAAVDAVSFQFGSIESLSALTTDGKVNNTSFSGSIAVPDGGLTVACLGFAFVGVETLRRKLRK